MKLQLSGVQDNSLKHSMLVLKKKNGNARKGIKEARTACNYLWCLVPEKGILKGKGKKESFYHVFQKLCEAISLYWISLPIVLLLLLSPQLLEPSIWKELFFFFFFSLVQALCHSETLHLLPRKQVWDGETRSQGALLFVNGWRATRTVTEPEITVSLLKQVNRGADLFIQYLCEPFPLKIPREKVLSVQVKSHLHSPDLAKILQTHKHLLCKGSIILSASCIHLNFIILNLKCGHS